MKTLKISTILSIAGIILMSSCQKSDVNPNGVGPKIGATDTTKTAPAPTVVPGFPTITGPTSFGTATSVTLTAHISNAQTYVWFNDLTPIAGQTGSTLTITTPGSYRVQGFNVVGEGDRCYAYVVTQ